MEERRNTVVGNNSKVRRANFEAAMTHGLRARFRPDATFGVKLDDRRRKMSFLYHGTGITAPGETIPATLAAKRLLYYVEAEAYALGLIDYLTPLYEAVRTARDQSEQQLSWYRTLGFDGYVKKLNATSARVPQHRQHRAGGPRTYYTVRQMHRGANPERVYLTQRGMARLGVRNGGYVWLSAPAGSIQARVAPETHSPNSIRLSDDEVRLGKSLRKRLGISMYDPVIVGDRRVTTFVTDRAGARWAPSVRNGGLGRARAAY